MTTLTMATEFGRGTIAADIIDEWAAKISTLSNGAFTIDVKHAGELVTAFEVFDAVTSGVVDLGWFSPFALSSEYSALSLGFETSPGAASSIALHRTLSDGVYDAYGLDLLAASFRDPMILVSNLNNPTSPSSIDGAKVVASGAAATLVQDLGGVSVNVPAAEIYQALATGVVDAAVVPASVAYRLKLEFATNAQVAFPDGEGLAISFSNLVISQAARASLPPEFLALIEQTTGEDFSAELGSRFSDDNEFRTGYFDLFSAGFVQTSGQQLSAWKAAVEASAAGILDTLPASARDLRSTFLEEQSTLTPLIEGIDNITLAEWDTGPWAVILPDNLGVERVEELDGATIVLPTGTDLEVALGNIFRNASIMYEPVPADTYAEAVQQFLAGAADVLIVPMSAVDPALVAASGNDIIVLEEGFNADGIVIPFQTDPGQPSTPAVAKDFDGDGDADIVWRNDDGTVHLWEIEDGLRQEGANIGGASNAWSIKDSGDFDGDGDDDFLWRNADGTAHIWEMEDGARVSGGNIAKVGLNWSIKGTGDADGDGDSDIFWFNDTTNIVHLWQMEDGVRVSGFNVANLSVSDAWNVRGVGDFDGDGDADVLWQNDNGIAHRWELEDGVRVNGQNIFNSPLSADWSFKDIADFDGDGDDDVLFQKIDGRTHIWEMENGVRVGGADVSGSRPDPDVWTLIDTGDYDGDGDADIIWQKNTGQVHIWEMEDGLRAAGYNLSDLAPGDAWSLMELG